MSLGMVHNTISVGIVIGKITFFRNSQKNGLNW